ncbi:unnamed protein product [Leptosia nina]|uniref:Uncharacterized protein n=1 Tax=Leptosia nina TaxID=320188 RepID=A0AAV1JMZ2_9NEOP
MGHAYTSKWVNDEKRDLREDKCASYDGAFSAVSGTESHNATNGAYKLRRYSSSENRLGSIEPRRPAEGRIYLRYLRRPPRALLAAHSRAVYAFIRCVRGNETNKCLVLVRAIAGMCSNVRSGRSQLSRGRVQMAHLAASSPSPKTSAIR